MALSALVCFATTHGFQRALPRLDPSPRRVATACEAYMLSNLRKRTQNRLNKRPEKGDCGVSMAWPGTRSPHMKPVVQEDAAGQLLELV